MKLSKLRYACYILLGLLIIPGVCSAAVAHLNGSSSPAQGTAGSTTLYPTGGGFPFGGNHLGRCHHNHCGHLRRNPAGDRNHN